MSHDVFFRVLNNSDASDRATQDVQELTARSYANNPAPTERQRELDYQQKEAVEEAQLCEAATVCAADGL